MIIPTCQTLAPSQVIPTLKRNLVQRNSVSRQGIAILGLAWPGLGLGSKCKHLSSAADQPIKEELERDVTSQTMGL